jgi:hypothetical protein
MRERRRREIIVKREAEAMKYSGKRWRCTNVLSK